MAKCCCCCDETTVKKGIWTAEEDHKLIYYVKKYGHWNWRRLPKFAGLLRCGKSCRLRWMNYLRPNIKRGSFTLQEEETIIKLYVAMGGRWSTMAAQMPGRTDNDIKNHWNTVLKRRVMKMKQQKMSMEKKPATGKAGPAHEVFAGEILSSNVNNHSTLIDQTAARKSELQITVEAFPPAGNMDVPVDDQLKSSSPQLPAASSPASSAGDFWTDPLWLDSYFEMPFDDQLYEGFGESNFFNVGLDEYLWQEGIY